MFGIHFYFSMDGTLDGEILRYGQSFYISTMPEEGGNVSIPITLSGLFPAILGNGPWPKLGKMIDLKAKLREIKGIEHNKGSKIYPQNQVILDCIMPTIPLKHKCLSIILIWVIVSHK